MNAATKPHSGIEIAIVGLAGRFPGAASVEDLWQNVCRRVESVSDLSDETLRAQGAQQSTLDDPAYVKTGVIFEGIESFDASFFGYTPREAELIDPQHRIFLECAWQAMEHAGYDALALQSAVGVFAGAGANLYLMRHLLPRLGGGIAEMLGLLNGNSADALSTRVAYKLGLRGPAVTVQTACSTSLVAVHMACQSLLGFECDMALAGGVWLNLLQQGGYLHQPGAILSSDGHCRAFDARADGTALGSGAGVVVLKRLDDAVRDGDTVHAVIRGSAVNNDGSAKVGYTAPSIDGQADVIRAAQSVAGVSPDSIGYVEAHGTGTTLGDPIEIAALTRAFRSVTGRAGYCAIGSLKTNIGHLDAAAGVAGLIKAVMAVREGILPPSLNFEQPNQRIDFARSPFYVNTEARPWLSGGQLRRAGVSSFGMGGTNAHVILEQAPQPAALSSDAAAEGPMLLLSAASASALTETLSRLADHLDQHSALRISDVAHTLRCGRRREDYRAVVLPGENPPGDAIAKALRGEIPGRLKIGKVLSRQPTLAFLFPGQGAQHAGMGRCLYAQPGVYRQTVDQCCELLRTLLDLDLRELLHPDESAQVQADERLQQTALTQPALFVVEYSMARLWMSWGLQPDAMLGHSIGEYVAACIAGVFSLEDALEIVAARGRLLQATRSGAMLAVGLGETELLSLPAIGCDIAAVNGAASCVLSGEEQAIAAVEARMSARGVAVRRLHVSHAFHSALVEPMLAEFERLLRGKRLQPPRIGFVSNVSGSWITPEQATSPAYWVSHVRGTVRFDDGLSTLMQKTDRVLLEVGPGDTLSTLARRHAHARGDDRPVLASQSHARLRDQEEQALPNCLAGLWIAGLEPTGKAWPGIAGRGRRVPLPTRVFQRQTYWVPAAPASAKAQPPESAAGARRDLADWFYAPCWRRGQTQPTAMAAAGGSVLVLGQQNPLVVALVEQLREQGRRVIVLHPGAAFGGSATDGFVLRLERQDDIEQAIEQVLGQPDCTPVTDVVHLWSLRADGGGTPASVLERGFHGLAALALALDARGLAAGPGRLAITVVTDQAEDVLGSEPLCPEQAALAGLCRVLPQEYPGLDCRLVDVLPHFNDVAHCHRLAQQLVAELIDSDPDPLVAWRGPHRWVKDYVPVRRDAAQAQRLRHRGVYFITGGLGGVGLVLARYLAQRWQARLALVARTSVPARASWPALLAADPTGPQSAQLRALMELESMGAELLLLRADVGDAADVAAAVAATRSRYGALDGVVHAAGSAGAGLLQSSDRAVLEAGFAAKITGTRLVLDSVLPGAPDFVLLCSSLASVAGGLGKGDYAAANACLDAMAVRQARDCPTPVFSVGWDGWRGTGMAAGMRLPEHVGIEPEQGGAVFEAIVNGGHTPHLLVCTTDLQERLAGLEKGALQALATGAAGVSTVPATVLRARPLLATAYVAPQADIEMALASIWSEFLGITPVGLEDNLFELGGDSLLAIQLLARVRSVFGVSVHPAVLFKTPTVASLAAQVETLLIEEIEADESLSATA